MNFLKKYIVNFLFDVLNSNAYKTHTQNKINEWARKSFKNFGTNSNLPEEHCIENPKYISIGKNFSSLFHLRLEAWDHFQGKALLLRSQLEMTSFVIPISTLVLSIRLL